MNNSTTKQDVFTVNDQSFEAFTEWCHKWSETIGVSIKLEKPKLKLNTVPPSTFKIIGKQELKKDNTFLLSFQNLNGTKSQSGDLLSVIPTEGAQERLYSIGKLDKDTLVVSIRRHEKGLCSNFLYRLEQGEKLSARVISNKNFHFPEKAKKCILIATGTGIGPFLGMINENIKKRELHLYWGARTSDSFNLYRNYIENAKEEGKLTSFNPAYSRNPMEKLYVQHLIKHDHELFVEVLKKKGCIMICGSIAMQKAILQELQELCNEHLNKDLSHFQNKNQIKMDCY
ncbi:ferredoxin reductase domain-containing protein [Arenibacter amylolyticus]|uniref:hypothetical protein n=1 Tax=Arenibacter amylolyticus TaxID=1406873 RepID=UPI0021CDC0A2|nr:hypothetical protein [Arenibacter amylolyticus]